MRYHFDSDGLRYSFDSLKELLAKATPRRSGDVLAGVAAESEEERAVAQIVLSEVPLADFIEDLVVPYEDDEVTRLIVDTHDKTAFAPISGFTVGEFRNWLLGDAADTATLAAIAPGVTPEMAAAVSKLMRLQDLVYVASKCQVVTCFRNTIGLPGTFSVRLQPNHPTDDLKGIAASTLDGLLYGCGDAVIGINPATDSVEGACRLLEMLDRLRERYSIPTQTCVLTHVTNTMEAIERGAPVDLTFQSIAGSEAANRSVGVSLSLLEQAWQATLALKRGSVGRNVMYFETGQGSALSANAHHGWTSRRWRRGPTPWRGATNRAGEHGGGLHRPGIPLRRPADHPGGAGGPFLREVAGPALGVDVCYTNHAEADQDDMDALLTLLGAANCTYVMGVPGADDIMLNYQSTSFHDAAYLRRLLKKTPAPEFQRWLESMQIVDARGELQPVRCGNRLLETFDAATR
jgi:ethanolamine ammonia-lyase large subunit